MKILIDLGDLDTMADDDEVLSVVRNALSNSHELESGDLLFIGSVTATIVESESLKKPSRSFLAWLKRHATRQDPIGDLARDAKDDAGAPKGRASKTVWLDYLRSTGACSGAIDAFREGWREFECEPAL